MLPKWKKWNSMEIFAVSPRAGEEGAAEH